MKINLMLPGNDFTQRNVQSLLNLLEVFRERLVDYELFWRYSSDIYGLRNGIVQKNGVKDVPFAGEPYDYMMWIDSDVEYTPDDVFELMYADKDIISGLVPIGPDERVAVGKYIMEGDRVGMAYLRGRVDHEELLEMDFCGFAFVLIKAGVFESIGFPWFQTTRISFGDQMIETSEDVGFCFRAKELGNEVWAHPRVRPGHEKELVMRYTYA